MTRILLNGEEAPAPGVLADLLRAHLGSAEPLGVAVAVNGAVVRRAEWPAHALADGDVVEVVTAVQGG